MKQCELALAVSPNKREREIREGRQSGEEEAAQVHNTFVWAIVKFPLHVALVTFGLVLAASVYTALDIVDSGEIPFAILGEGEAHEPTVLTLSA